MLVTKENSNVVCVGGQLGVEQWKSKEWSPILVTDGGYSVGEWSGQGHGEGIRG